YELEPTTADTYTKIVPGVPSFREINVINMYNQCLKMQTTDAKKYGWTNSNAHMMKNSEWGAVAYLSASQYGVVPTINNVGKWISWKNGENTTTSANYDIMAGTDNYITKKTTSTTANVYGVYDMNGGSWEYTAAYLDNNNTAGNGNGLLTADSRYKDVYKVSDEEKNNKIKDTILNDGTTLTQYELDNKNNTYNPIRKRITNATYNLMANMKGDGIYETIEDGNYSYWGSNSINYGAGTWIKNIDETNNASTNWDVDYTLLGQSYYNFFFRGGSYNNSICSGIFSISSIGGGSYDGYTGFRMIISNN
ncbi:MAG: hypothetical protein RSC92_04860, partial [Clostridia bacterium]